MSKKVESPQDGKQINKVEVVIAGEIITLKSTEEAAHLHRIAQYVDKKISEITSSSQTPVIDERVRTLLMALNIADDCFKKLDSLSALEATHKKYVKEMGRMQEENKLLQQKVNKLKEELTATRKELDDFIQNFNDEEKSDKILTIPSPDTRKAARQWKN